MSHRHRNETGSFFFDGGGASNSLHSDKKLINFSILNLRALVLVRPYIRYGSLDNRLRCKFGIYLHNLFAALWHLGYQCLIAGYSKRPNSELAEKPPPLCFDSCVFIEIKVIDRTVHFIFFLSVHSEGAYTIEINNMLIFHV